ncbi:MAG TPA: type 1 glutamine amidotransferase [Gaiellaceae bacterium]|nr:type 1 glutamine amidotransferase [Gaiellaceae bacterium]
MPHSVTLTPPGSRRSRPARRERPGAVIRGLRIAVVQHDPATGPGSFGELLAQAGVEAELIRAGEDPPPAPAGLDGAIALGGSARASDPAFADERRWIRRLVAGGTPYLGICLGAQLLAAAFGAAVVPARRPEIGVGEVFLTEAARGDRVFSGLPRRLPAFRWHGDTFGLPDGAVLLASSGDGLNQAFRLGPSAYGLQFHPEATARGVAAWPWEPGYLDQLQAAGVDGGEAVGKLAAEEPGLRALARALLGNWLGLCAEAAGTRAR